MASDVAPQTVNPAGELDEQDDGRNRRALFVGLITAALILFVLWLVWINLARVPDVVGMDRYHANVAFENAGLNLGKVAATGRGKVLPGQVAIQAATPGSLLFKGATIDVAVKTGPEASLLGASYALNGYVAPLTTPQQPWWVTTPGLGAGQPAPAAIQGTSSYVGVPNVLNMSQSEAVSRLNSAGYATSVKTGPSTAGVAAGHVYYENPAPNGADAPGSTVTVWISTGPLGTGFPYPQPVPDPQ